ncbi:MAG: AAA family ATPase [Terriglobales bacterium]|jgi:predicted kinase
MRKWVRDRIRKKKTTPNDTEQTGHIGQSKKTFEGAAAPLQPAYYDAPAAGPQDARIETETQPESVSAPPASPEAATGHAPRQKTPRAPKGVVVLTIGLPGSGKTTWFKRRGVTPLSSDMLRSLLFDDITEQRYQNLVFSTLRSLLRARLIAKMPWNYVDATNLSPRERKQWIGMARSFGYEVQAVFFDVPLEVCLERNRKRERIVSEEVMRNLAQRLKAPTFDEGFSKIVVVRVKSKDSAAEE